MSRKPLLSPNGLADDRAAASALAKLVAIRITPEMLDEIRDVKRKSTSFSEYVREAIEEKLARDKDTQLEQLRRDAERQRLLADSASNGHGKPKA